MKQPADENLSQSQLDVLARTLAGTPAGRSAMRRALAAAASTRPRSAPLLNSPVQPGHARWIAKGIHLIRAYTPISGRTYLRSVTSAEFCELARDLADVVLSWDDRPWPTLIAVKVDRRPRSPGHRGAIVFTECDGRRQTPDGKPGRQKDVWVGKLQSADAVFAAFNELRVAGGPTVLFRDEAEEDYRHAPPVRRRGSYCSAARVRDIARVLGKKEPPAADAERAVWLREFAHGLTQRITRELESRNIDINIGGSDGGDFRDD